MKFYNKKAILRSDWLAVEIRSSKFLEAKAWCKANKSTGRFYVQPYVRTWRFEFKDDALAFKLAWDYTA